MAGLGAYIRAAVKLLPAMLRQFGSVRRRKCKKRVSSIGYDEQWPTEVGKASHSKYCRMLPFKASPPRSIVSSVGLQQKDVILCGLQACPPGTELCNTCSAGCKHCERFKKDYLLCIRVSFRQPSITFLQPHLMTSCTQVYGRRQATLQKVADLITEKRPKKEVVCGLGDSSVGWGSPLTRRWGLHNRLLMYTIKVCNALNHEDIQRHASQKSRPCCDPYIVPQRRMAAKCLLAVRKP